MRNCRRPVQSGGKQLWRRWAIAPLSTARNRDGHHTRLLQRGNSFQFPNNSAFGMMVRYKRMFPRGNLVHMLPGAIGRGVGCGQNHQVPASCTGLIERTGVQTCQSFQRHVVSARTSGHLHKGEPVRAGNRASGFPRTDRGWINVQRFRYAPGPK